MFRGFPILFFSTLHFLAPVLRGQLIELGDLSGGDAGPPPNGVFHEVITRMHADRDCLFVGSEALGQLPELHFDGQYFGSNHREGCLNLAQLAPGQSLPALRGDWLVGFIGSRGISDSLPLTITAASSPGGPGETHTLFPLNDTSPPLYRQVSLAPGISEALVHFSYGTVPAGRSSGPSLEYRVFAEHNDTGQQGNHFLLVLASYSADVLLSESYLFLSLPVTPASPPVPEPSLIGLLTLPGLAICLSARTKWRLAKKRVCS